MNISSNVYLSEEQLVELFQQHKINWVQYVELHSEEMKDDYRDYCIVNGIGYKSKYYGFTNIRRTIPRCMRNLR